MIKIVNVSLNFINTLLLFKVTLLLLTLCLISVESYSQRYEVRHNASFNCIDNNSNYESEYECITLRTTGPTYEMDKNNLVFTTNGRPTGWEWEYFHDGIEDQFADAWEYRATDDGTFTTDVVTNYSISPRDPSPRCFDGDNFPYSNRCFPTPSPFTGPSMTIQSIKPIVGITTPSGTPSNPVIFCGDNTLSLSANTGWANDWYQWYYKTPSSGWIRISGKSSPNIQVSITDLGTSLYNTRLQFGVGVGRTISSLYTPDNMAGNTVVNNIEFQPPIPGVDTPPTPSAPLCKDGEGSFTILHSADSPEGTQFNYTITQLIYLPSGSCGSGTELRNLGDIRTDSDVKGVFIDAGLNNSRNYCTGFIGNFTHTIDDASNINDRKVIIDENGANGEEITTGPNELKLLPGLYEIKIEATGNVDSDCIDIYYFEIPESTSEIVVDNSNITDSPPICLAGTGGTVEIPMTIRGDFDGTYNVQYTLGGNIISKDLTSGNLIIGNLTAGSYTVDVKDVCKTDPGDVKTVSFTIDDGPAIATTTTGFEDAKCANDGSITITVDDLLGVDHTFILKENGSEVDRSTDTNNTETFDDLFNGGNYSVDVVSDQCENAIGIFTHDMPTITDVRSSISLGSPSNIACSDDGNTGSITLDGVQKVTPGTGQIAGDINISYTVTGGTPSTTYTGTITSSGDGVQLESGLSPGSYTVSLTDNCKLGADKSVALSGTSSFMITKPSAISLDAIGNETLDCFDETVTKTVEWNTGSGILYNNGPYSILITKNGETIQSVTGHATNSISTVELGVDNTHAYSLTVTDACGISDNTTFTVRSNATSAIQATVSAIDYPNGFNLTCYESSDGRIIVRPSGGVPFTSGSKDYQVEIRDLASPAPGGSTIVDAMDCETGNSRSCFQFNGLDKGITYQIGVTDAEGCTKYSTQSSLTHPNQLVITEITDDSFTNAEKFGGQYYLQCKGSDNITYTAEVTGGNEDYIYKLFRKNTSAGNFSDISFLESEIKADLSHEFPNLGPGFYKIEVQDANSCGFDRREFEILEAEIKLNATAITAENTFSHGATTKCYGESDGGIVVNVEGGRGNYTYRLFDNGGNEVDRIAKAATTHTFTGLPAITSEGEQITYSVYVTDQLGCEWNAVNISRDFQLTSPNPISFSHTVTSETDLDANLEILCRGDQADITITSNGGKFPHQVTISGGGLTSNIVRSIDDPDNDNTGSVIIQLSAGDNYTMTLEDDLECSIPSTNFSLRQPDNHVRFASTVLEPPVCIGGNDGTISVSAEYGSPGETDGEEYTFKIKKTTDIDYDTEEQNGTSAIFFRPAGGSNGQSSQDYEIAVFDRYNCFITQTVTMVPNPAPLTLEVTDQAPPSCNGGSDGTITVNVTNQTAVSDLTYYITDGHFVDDTVSFTSSDLSYTYENLQGNSYVGPYTVW
ncbi:MAG: hypothetical protein WBA74_03490, partial [Cyclobacteriaceae bacterium]